MTKRADKHAKPDGQMGQANTWRALTLGLVLAGATAAFYFSTLAGQAARGHDRSDLWPVVVLGVWAAFSQSVTLRNRQFSLNIALSEIPALVGIVFLSPWAVLAAITVGHLAASVQQRISPAKALDNVLLYVAAVAVGILFYDHAIGSGPPTGGRGWWVSIATIALVNAVNLVLLLAVMAVVDSRWRRPPLRAIGVQAGIGVAVCTAGGLVAVSLVWVNTWGILLFIAIAVAANVAYHGTVASSQRYANLEKLYEFTRGLGSLVEAHDVMLTVLEEGRALLSAGRAQLVVPLGEAYPGMATRCSVDGDEPANFDSCSPLVTLDEMALARGALLLDEGTTRTDPALAQAVAAQGLTEVLVAPLQRDDPAAGFILVADRAFRHEGFRRADLRFFEALAANAGVSLRSSKLLEQLRQEAAERQQQAQHDALTGLPNRLLFTERLEETLDSALPGDQLAVMIIDLDGFKDVNDTLGHHTGDAILCEVAARLAPLARGADLVARLGGDEFALLVSKVVSDQHVVALADRVIASIAEPVAVDGLLLDVRASLGVALSPQHSEDASGLLRQADIAMYAAKSAGGGYRLYDKAEDRSTLRRLRLATELRRAIEHDDLDVWYQPVVQLATGAVVGCEALLRWNHDQFGPISPTEFIPVAESTGLIDELTFSVLHTALTQAKRWRQLVLPDLSMSVNLSARTLMSMDIPARLGQVLEEVGIEPEALTLELTESSTLSDPVSSQKIFEGLRQLGVNLSIDDYGTGFSSLSRLKHLPFDELKIDRSFVKEMIHDKGDEAIVRSTIELARYLGRTVTAEGVEDQATLQALEALGCHSAQGFFLARPLPAPQCEAWLLAASNVLGSTPRVPRLSERTAKPHRPRLPRNGTSS